jgi:hypothetical protein
MVNNDATFFTDSNGREFIKRQRNYRPTWDLTVYQPVAGNYYPVNAGMYVEDAKTKSAFAVVTDRTQGGSSLRDGTMELMVHRRTLKDDYRGVSEPINETDIGITPNPPWGNATRIGRGLVIRGKHRILVSGSSATSEEGRNKSMRWQGGASLARSVMDDAFAEPLVFAGSARSSDKVPFRTSSFSGLETALPKNVMLITKRLLYDEVPRTYLIRLGHQYGIHEDPKLSQPATVDLQSLFPGQTIQTISETTLSGNLDISSWYQRRLDWIGSGGIDPGRPSYEPDGPSITIEPMDIRTFKVTVLETTTERVEEA